MLSDGYSLSASLLCLQGHQPHRQVGFTYSLAFPCTLPAVIFTIPGLSRHMPRLVHDACSRGKTNLQKFRVFFTFTTGLIVPESRHHHHHGRTTPCPDFIASAGPPMLGGREERGHLQLTSAFGKGDETPILGQRPSLVQKNLRELARMGERSYFSEPSLQTW